MLPYFLMEYKRNIYKSFQFIFDGGFSFFFYLIDNKGSDRAKS